MPLEFMKLNQRDLAGLTRERTVFFFPVGPLEGHGPHLPIGLDLMAAKELSFRLAQQLEKEMPEWTAILMPETSLGIDSNTSTLKLTVRPHVLRDWLVDACRALVKSGFLYFTCVSGHLGPRQLTAIEEAGKIIKRKSGFFRRFRGHFLSLSSACVSGKEVSRAPFWVKAEEHGGEKDTSIALGLSEWTGQNLVAPLYLNLPPQQKGDYWGNPAIASVAKGDEWFSSDLNRIFPKLRRVLEGAPPRSLFRSWYSVLPPNWSFFRGWIFLVLTFLMMALWVYVSLKFYES